MAKTKKALVKLLRERDGDICGICGLTFTHWKGISEYKGQFKDLGITIDHIIPKSKNGQNTISNYKLAHLACNNLRGDDEISDTLIELCRKTIELREYAEFYLAERKTRAKGIARGLDRVNCLLKLAREGIAKLEIISNPQVIVLPHREADNEFVSESTPQLHVLL
jgi:hypothetical protein